MTSSNVADLSRGSDPRYTSPRGPASGRLRQHLRRATDAVVGAVRGIETSVTRYVRGPQALLRSRALHIEPARTVTRTDESRIPRPLVDSLARLEREAMSAGFGAPHRITHGNAEEIRSVGALLEHSGTGDLASIACIRSGSADKPRLTAMISFVTELTDGHRLVTSNSGSAVMWPPQPGHEIVRFPTVSDARELYALHRCRVEGRRTSSPRPVTRGATEAERLAYADRESQAFQRHLIQIGYRVPTLDGLRHTVRGATLSAWRTMWPWKQWIDVGNRRRAAALLRARARTLTRG